MKVLDKYKIIFAKEFISYFKFFLLSMLFSLLLIIINYLNYNNYYKKYLTEQKKWDSEYNILINNKKIEEDKQRSLIIEEYKSIGKPSAESRIKAINKKLKENLSLSDKIRLKNELTILYTYIEDGPNKSNINPNKIVEELEEYYAYHKSYEVFLGDKKNALNTPISLNKYLTFTFFSFLTILCLRYLIHFVQWIYKTVNLS